MDHLRIIKRAFEVTRFYRALWVFGILVALTTAGSAGNGGGGGSGSGATSGQEPGTPGNFPNFPWPNIPSETINTIIAVAVGLICLLVIIGIAFTILRYLSQTSLMRMVDRYESAEERVTVGEGFRLGWSRGAFRTWLVDLLFFIVGAIVFVLLLLLAAAPLLLWLTGNETAGIVGTVITVGLAMLLILTMIIVGAVISLLTEMVRREIVLGGKGVFDGLASGWRILRSRLGDVIIMGLILFGIGIVVSVITIPVFLILAATGVFAGGLPALLVGGITNLFAQGATPFIVGGAVGVPILLAVIFLPMLFISGLVETFYSTTWTLTYRELLALEAVRAEQPPASPLLGPDPAELSI